MSLLPCVTLAALLPVPTPVACRLGALADWTARWVREILLIVVGVLLSLTVLA